MGQLVAAAHSLLQPLGYLLKEEKQVSPFIEHHVPELQVSVHDVFLEDNKMVCIMKVSEGSCKVFGKVG